MNEAIEFVDAVIEPHAAASDAGNDVQNRACESHRSAGTNDTWRRFSDVCAELPPPGSLIDALAGPAWADVWARAIICFWETELAEGALDPAEPAYLLDIDAASGTLAWLLLRALDAQLPSSRAAALRICYVACGEDAASVAPLRANPRFAPLIEQSRFDTACWKPQDGDAPTLHGRTAPVSAFANPVIVLASGWFCRQRAALCAAHYGAWTEAWVALSAPGDGSNTSMIEYDWRPSASDKPGAGCDEFTPLIERYRANLVSAPILLPLCAARFIAALQRLSSNRYLLLACDAGAACESDIRDGALATPQRWEADVSAIPVNFHALAALQHTAWTCSRTLEEHRLVLHAAWSRGGRAADDAALRAMQAILDRWAPLDALHLAQTAEAMAGARANAHAQLALLRSSDYDPRVLRAIAPHWLTAFPELSNGLRRAWQTALDRTWSNTLASAHEFDIALLAVALGNWRLATAILRERLARGADPLAAHFYLAQSLAASGRLDDALTHARRARALAPDDEPCSALGNELEARAARRLTLPWYRPDWARDGTLVIEPLGLEHAQAFIDCYAAPHIALMANLPELHDLDDARAWIGEEASRPNRMTCAVIDGERGFCGVVSLHCGGNAGYFHFWLDAGAQGQGLGTRAARRLFAMAEAAGITGLFTTAYLCNGRSLRALSRLEFCRLPVRSPDEPDTAFFYRPAREGLPDRVDDSHAATEFAALCEAIGEPVALDVASP
jgi:RimJ/RimL family protein N-acetyltransferase